MTQSCSVSGLLVCSKNVGVSSNMKTYRKKIQERGEKQYNFPVSGIDGLSNQNIFDGLLVQLLVTQRRRRDIGKSEKRKHDQTIPTVPPLLGPTDNADPQQPAVPPLGSTNNANLQQPVPPLGLTDNGNPPQQEPVPPLVPTDNADPQQSVPPLDKDLSDDDQNNEHAAFRQTVQPFLDPDFHHLIACLSNQTTDEDMVIFNQLFQLVNEAYQKKKGANRNVEV
jgi:hypothetical protein